MLREITYVTFLAEKLLYFHKIWQKVDKTPRQRKPNFLHILPYLSF